MQKGTTMKLLALDLETTGLDSYSNTAIEIGAVIFDPIENSPEDLIYLPKFSAVMDCGHAIWDKQAKEMNQWYFDVPRGGMFSQEHAWNLFKSFIQNNTSNRISLCGANVALFDRSFIPEDICEELLTVRALDIGSFFFDGEIPSLHTLCERHLNKPCSHRALEDAMDTAELVMMKFEGRI
jgi:oligoribonuclease (3'-5' exoribonuclease)